MALTVQESRTHDCIQDACKEYVNKSHKINWEQRRYEIAKELYPKLLEYNDATDGRVCAQRTVQLTDYLIEELKK